MDGYPFSLPYRVHIADINYGGHVANSALLDYFQEARLAFLAVLGPYSELDVGEGRGLIMPEARVRYLAEMFHGDELTVGVKVLEIRGSSFTLGYRVERKGKPCAEGETVLAVFDYSARRPRRLPEAFRQALERQGLGASVPVRPGQRQMGGALL